MADQPKDNPNTIEHSPSTAQEPTSSDMDDLLKSSFEKFLKIEESKSKLEDNKQQANEEEEEEAKGAKDNKEEKKNGQKNKSTDDKKAKVEHQFWEQFEQLSSNCKQFYKDADEQQFAEQLKTVEELTKNMDQGNFLEEMETIWKDIINPEEVEKNLGNMSPAMDKMMFEIFFNGFKPLFGELKEKLPRWVEKNRDNLSDSDVARYEQQIKLIEEMCREMAEYKENTPNDKLVEKTHDITKELERLGPLPKEVLGDHSAMNGMPFGNANPQMPELPKECCIM